MSVFASRPYRGVFPVAPTIFDESGDLDLDGQRRCTDFMIDAGSHGICILANFSEQFLLTDRERDEVMHAVFDHVGGRVPVIVTTSHFSTRVCIERSRQAQAAGAAMVMVLPPYHGATLRVSEAGIFDFFAELSDAITIPIMLQDAPISGTSLPAASLARMSGAISNLRYFKIETAQAAAKLREMIRLGGESVEGPWDGEEGITLLPDLEAGATGTMTGAGYPDGIRRIFDAFAAGNSEEAALAYQHWLPLINFENRQCGLSTAKILLKEGGVIGSDLVRRPLSAVPPAIRDGLLRTARRLDPLVLRWAK